ncbi:MAG: NAD-dependent epimerase/dehydratase family protein [Verrucomicrobium sp.]|nr:NAD-dependent epimerase/dehydratase family protein [Verrucomicrobium sp.]
MSALGADPASNARYQRTKGEAEALVRASALSWTIFQPSIVFGPGDQFVNQFARLLRFPFNLLQAYSFPLIGGGGTLFQPVAVEDVAEAFARALERPETAGKTYVLAGAERVSLREILEEVARLTGQRRVVEEAPFLLTLRLLLWAGVAAVLMAVLVGQSFSPRGAALWVFAYGIALAWRQLIFFRLPWKAAEAAGAVFEKILPKPPLTRDQVLMLRRDNVGDATPAERDLGLAWRPFRAGIAAYLPGRR